MDRDRIRRARRLLRYLPRRAQLERIPLFRKFSDRARRNPFLWSFAPRDAMPALLVGWVISLMPIMGVQIPVAILCAFLFRANVLILVALQFLTNPLTVPFIWPLVYRVGALAVALLGNDLSALPPAACQMHGWLPQWFASAFRLFATTTLGGILCGIGCAAISCPIYSHLYRRRQTRRNHPHTG
jgi:uncharacterized protein (DUF2062 family)